MYEQYWGLSSTAFDNRITGRAVCESPVYEEALARLLYSIEQKKALAVLHGPAGSGKSQMLADLAGQIRRTQRFLARASLLNLDERGFLKQLETGLRLGETDSDSTADLWRRLGEFFQSAGESRLQSVLLIDDAEAAQDSALVAIRRLIGLHQQNQAEITIILSLRPGRSSQSLKDLLERADLGIELAPFDRGETASYIQSRLKAVGGEGAEFEPDAIEAVQQLTAGVPREINRVCELALLAGMGEDKTTIDRPLIANLRSESTFRSQQSAVDFGFADVSFC